MGEHASRETNSPQRQYEQVLSTVGQRVGLADLTWRDTGIPVDRYLRQQVEVFDAATLLKGVDGTAYEKALGLNMDIGAGLFYDAFCPQLSQRKQYTGMLNTTVHIALREGVLLEGQFDWPAFDRLKRRTKPWLIAYTELGVQHNLSTMEKMLAAETGHLVARSFGLPLPLDIDEAFDRAFQTIFGEPVKTEFDPQEMMALDQMRRDDARMIAHWRLNYEGAADRYDAAYRATRSTVPTMPQTVFDEVVMKPYRHMIGEAVPTLEHYLTEHKSLYDGAAEHWAGEYIVAQVYNALGADQEALHVLPAVMVNALRLRKQEPETISMLSFDAFAQSVIANLERLR